MGVGETVRGMFSGGVGDPASASSDGGDSSAVDTSVLREEIGASRRKRSDAGRPRGRRRVGVDEGTEITKEEIDALFQAENWETLASLPFDTRYVMTGWAGFRLDNEERKRLAQTTATTMRILLKIDPKYIALAVWGTMYFGTWAAKEAAYSGEKHKALAARRDQAKTQATTAMGGAAA